MSAVIGYGRWNCKSLLMKRELVTMFPDNVACAAYGEAALAIRVVNCSMASHSRAAGVPSLQTSDNSYDRNDHGKDPDTFDNMV